MQMKWWSKTTLSKKLTFPRTYWSQDIEICGQELDLGCVKLINWTNIVIKRAWKRKLQVLRKIPWIVY